MTSPTPNGRWRHLLVVAGLSLASMGNPLTGGHLWAQMVELRPALEGGAANVVIWESTLSVHLFGSPQAAKTARERLECSVSLKVAEIDRICDLSATQRETLSLAGQGDVERLFTRIEALKETYSQPITQEAYRKMQEDARPIQLAMGQEWLGEKSLFSKTLNALLDGSQAALCREYRSEKARTLYREKLEQFVVYLDFLLGLSADQRRRVVEVLLEETQPPKKYSTFDSAIIHYQVARIPEARLKPIFDDAQWQSLRRLFAQWRMPVDALIEKGFLPRGFDDSKRPTP